jgi:Gas vesicle protein
MQIDSYRNAAPLASGSRGDLADILERVLDKGIVVAGDIAINLLDIELLTIKLRLLIASADTARKMGIDWWENDPFLTSKSGDGQSGGQLGEGSKRPQLEERLERIESALQALSSDRQHEKKEP